MKKFINLSSKKFLTLCVILICLLAGFVPKANAQGSDSKGKDFWLMFDANYNNSGTLTLFITSDVNTSGTVSIPGISFSAPFTVTANTVTSVVVPTSVSIHVNDVVDDLGIHVTSDAEVTVYGLNQIPFTTDAYLGLPTDVLGTDYIVLNYKSGSLGGDIGIVGTANGTTVAITPSVTTLSHTAGVAYNITLNQGQTYELENTGDVNADLTGTLITSSKPVGVMGTVRCANIPPGAGYCDHICEMLPPTTTWGKKFGTVPLKSRSNGDTWRFLASENNTIVSINGVAQPAINKGQFIETLLSTQSIIESNNPILVAQYSNGSTFSGNPGDPFMMLIPPLEQFLADYTLTTVSGFVAHYINLIAPNSIVGSLTLDGTSVPASEFSPIGSTGYSGAQLTVEEGSHTLKGALPFGAFQYGFNQDDSYGYPGGQSFSEVATVTQLSLAPATGSAPVNTNQCFQATVQDQFSTPVKDVRVDFSVLGANNGVTGFSFTDLSGHAQFCYNGVTTGIDTVVASIGSLTDTSFFTWTKTNNQAPHFTYPPTPTDGTEYDVMAGQPVHFSVEAADDDAGDNVTLTATGLPAGATSTPSLPAMGNPVTNDFSWTPGAGDVGTYTIQYKADDGKGGMATTNVIVSVSNKCNCDPNYQVHIGVIPKYTVKGQQYHTIYKGYGLQHVALLAAHHGGTAPYTYQWSDGATSHINVVSPDVTTNYTVTITDAHGCSSTCNVTIYVVDVRCTTPGNIFVCYNGETMSVPKADVQKWLDQGAKLGQCNWMDNTIVKEIGSAARTTGNLKPVAERANAFTVYPNPAKGVVNFAWTAPAGSNAKVVITDMQGRILISQPMAGATQRVDIGKLVSGMYMAKLVTADGTIATGRFMVSK